MAKQGKRFQAVHGLVDGDRKYTLEEAIPLLKRTQSAKFDESAEVAMHLGVNPRHPDQQVRGVLSLPHGIGKTVRVAVFAKGENALEAEQAGADVVGAEDLVQKVQEGWLEFDTAVATPDMMSQVGKLGKVLGPRGLMPNPKSGTVTFDVGSAVKQLKAGRIEYRTDRNANVNLPFGKLSFEENQLLENCSTVIDAILRAKPAAAKGRYLRSASLSSTMGPGIKLDVVQLASAHKR